MLEALAFQSCSTPLPTAISRRQPIIGSYVTGMGSDRLSFPTPQSFPTLRPTGTATEAVL